MQTLGILGVGHLAEFIVTGLRNGGDRRPIVVSPRNAMRSADLAVRFGVQIGACNQAVVDKADIVIVATPPAACLAAASGVSWRAGQILLSMVAGITLAQLRAAAPAATVVRAIPTPSSSIGVDTICILPATDAVSRLLAPLGTVYTTDDEARFATLATVGLLQLWAYGLFSEMAEAAFAAGLDRETAASIVASHMRSAADYVHSHGPTNEARATLEREARPGTLTRAGLDVLEAQRAFPVWRDAFFKTLPISHGHAR